jgi:hypothetical protein
MESIAKILMERDGITWFDAVNLLRDVRDECLRAIEIGDDPEQIFMDFVGLEPDYLFDLLLGV